MDSVYIWPREKATKTMQEIRIAWKIGSATGNGLWFPATKENTIKANVDYANARYGEGTHWIEKRYA